MGLATSTLQTMTTPSDLDLVSCTDKSNNRLVRKCYCDEQADRSLMNRPIAPIVKKGRMGYLR